MNCYKIVMSRGLEIPVDKDELPKIVAGIQGKQPVLVRRGLFNPSFFVSIVEDIDRIEGYNRDFGHGKFIPAESNSRPLPDMFEGVKDDIKTLIESTALSLSAGK